MKYRLGDICTITKGDTGIMKAIPGEFTMVALGEADKTHNEFQFDTKAVIIPLVSSTGHGHASMKRVKYQEGKFSLGSILCAVIPKDENFLLAKYLHIYLHWNREELLVSQMKGMANVSLPMNRIADVIVTVPSLDKQKEIIELEKTLVEKENEADRLFADQLTQLENLNQAILQEAVQGKLVAQDATDEPASELLKRIKAEKLNRVGLNRVELKPNLKRKTNILALKGEANQGETNIKPEEIPFEIPETWVWCRLSEITELITSGSRDWAKYYSSEGEIFVRMGNLSKNSFELRMDKIQYVKPPKNQEGNRTRLVENDILISITGEVGNLGLIPKDFGEAYINQHTGLVRLVSEIQAKYISFLFISKTLQEQFNAPQRGIKNSFRLSDIEYLLIPLPPLSEQKRIVAEIEKQLAKTKQLKEYIITNQLATENLLKALLHQAFEIEE